VSPGNVEFVQVVTTMIVVPAALAMIVRAVVFATWQFGILFGCPALLVWFIRTRRSGVGVLLGLAWAGLLFAAAIAASFVPEVAIDWLGL
jgi:hypothetical protein